MRLSWIVCGLLIGALFADARRMDSQTNAVVDQDAQTYRLSVSVDEVILTFHAADVQGLSSDDLKLNDLKLLDDGKPPRKILDFKLLQDFPVRAGILVDTSLSMRKQLPGDRAIAMAQWPGQGCAVGRSAKVRSRAPPRPKQMRSPGSGA